MFNFKNKKPKAYRSVLTLYLYNSRWVEVSAGIPEPADAHIPWAEFQNWFIAATQDRESFRFYASNDEDVIKFGAISHYSIRVEEDK